MVATYMRCMRKKNLEIRIAVACVAGRISVALAASSHRVAAPPPCFLNVLLDHNQYVTYDSFKKYDWG